MWFRRSRVRATLSTLVGESRNESSGFSRFWAAMREQKASRCRNFEVFAPALLFPSYFHTVRTIFCHSGLFIERTRGCVFCSYSCTHVCAQGWLTRLRPVGSRVCSNACQRVSSHRLCSQGGMTCRYPHLHAEHHGWCFSAAVFSVS